MCVCVHVCVCVCLCVRVATFFCASPSSAVSTTSEEDGGLRGIEALCAFLSAAGAGLGAEAGGVKMVGRVGDGTPVRFTSQTKLSDTSPIERAGEERPARGEEKLSVDSV